MDLCRPVPFPIRHGLKRPRCASSEPAFDAVPQAGIEFRLGEAFEQDDGTPALLRGARDEVIQLGGGVDEPELAQLVTQRRRDRIE